MDSALLKPITSSLIAVCMGFCLLLLSLPAHSQVSYTGTISAGFGDGGDPGPPQYDRRRPGPERSPGLHVRSHPEKRTTVTDKTRTGHQRNNSDQRNGDDVAGRGGPEQDHRDAE